MCHHLGSAATSRSAQDLCHSSHPDQDLQQVLVTSDQDLRRTAVLIEQQIYNVYKCTYMTSLSTTISILICAFKCVDIIFKHVTTLLWLQMFTTVFTFVPVSSAGALGTRVYPRMLRLSSASSGTVVYSGTVLGDRSCDVRRILGDSGGDRKDARVLTTCNGFCGHSWSLLVTHDHPSHIHSSIK